MLAQVWGREDERQWDKGVTRCTSRTRCVDMCFEKDTWASLDPLDTLLSPIHSHFFQSLVPANRSTWVGPRILIYLFQNLTLWPRECRQSSAYMVSVQAWFSLICMQREASRRLDCLYLVKTLLLALSGINMDAFSSLLIYRQGGLNSSLRRLRWFYLIICLCACDWPRVPQSIDSFTICWAAILNYFLPL